MRAIVRNGRPVSSLVDCTTCEWGEREGEAFGDEIPRQTRRARYHVERTGHRVNQLRTFAVAIVTANLSSASSTIEG